MTTAIQPVPSGLMADDSSTSKPRTIRMEQRLWDALGPAGLATHGLDRSGLLRQFARWYLHEPGAQLPQRPDRTED